MKPHLGQIVHYVVDHGVSLGEHCPAIVVRVWNDQHLNLRIFPDGIGSSAEEWKTNVGYDSRGHQAGTWHFMEESPLRAA